MGPLNEQCSTIKPNGEHCRGTATGPHGYCWAHDPENAEQRRRQASRAARAKGNQEVVILKGEIKAIIAEVKSGDLDRNDAAVMIQGYRVLKDFIELERRVKETDELEQRVEQFEAKMQGIEREKAWGA